MQGKCTPDISAPRTLDDCPQGDWPDVRCQRHFCHRYPQHYRDIFCCKTCQEPQPVHNFIYSPANSPVAVQIETVTRRMPALPGFEPPPTTPATTTTTTPATTTTTTPTTTTTIPQTSQPSTSPLTTTFSSESTMNETTTQSMTSDKPRMTSSVTSLSVENSISASTPASKTNTTSSPVDPWEVPRKAHSHGNLMAASTASTKSHTQNTPPSKTAADVTSEGQDYLTTTSSVTSGSSRVTSSSNAAADPMTSKQTGHYEGSVVTTPSVTTDNSGVTTNSSIQLDRSDRYRTTIQRNSMPETSENPLQLNVPSHTTLVRRHDPLDASAGSKSSTEKPSSEHQPVVEAKSSSQDSLSGLVTKSSVNLQTTSTTTTLATSESFTTVLKANTSNEQVDNGNTSRVESAQNSTFWDTILHNSGKISTADAVPQNTTRKSAAENNLDVSFGKRDGSSMTSLSTNDTMDALEQRRQVTTSGTPSEIANGSSKQEASSFPQTDVVLSTPSSVQQSSAAGLISGDIGKTSAPDSAGTYPEGTTLPPPGNESLPSSPAEGKLNDNHPNKVTGHESSPHPQSAASTPVDNTAQDGSLSGPLPPKELIDQLLANASPFPLQKPQASETSGDSSLGRSDNSSVSENSTVAPVSSSTNQLLDEYHLSAEKPQSQSSSSTLVHGSFGSSGVAPKSHISTDNDLNGPHFALFNSNKSEARNLQTTGGVFSESNDSVLLQDSSKAELTVQSSGSDDSVQVQNNSRTESILTSPGSNASVLIQNGYQTHLPLSSLGFNYSVPTQDNIKETESFIKSVVSNAFVATLNSSNQTEPILDPSGSNAFVATLNSSNHTEPILDPSGSNAFVATLNSSSLTQFMGKEESQPSLFAERLPPSSSLHPKARLGVSVHDLDKIARPLPSVSRFPNVPFIRFRTTSVTTWLPPTAVAEDPAFFAPPETSQSASQPRRCLALCQLFRAPTLNSGNTFMDGMSRFFRSRMETTFDRLGHERPRIRQLGDLYRLAPSGDRVTPVSRMDYLYPRRRRVRKRRAG
ncbi:hypothetical protein V1264_009587 [Littorina saxatilis]|uniref:Uncharacterized protein n=2 Tax=Littorina saxatilis TaxID=31220 RepID=A0AAN9ARS0_9CAEN